MAEALIKKRGDFSKINLPVFLVVFITHKFNGIVGFNALEHCRSVLKQSFSWKDLKYFEVKFEDYSNISRVFLSFSCTYTFLEKRAFFLLQIQESKQDLI
jgi:hypothetical protein